MGLYVNGFDNNGALKTSKRFAPPNTTRTVWPINGLQDPSGVLLHDVFGPRPFAAHISTVGYDYDMHRAVDFNRVYNNQPAYAASDGIVNRWHYTHFSFKYDNEQYFFDQQGATLVSTTYDISGDGNYTIATSGTSSFQDSAKIVGNQQSAEGYFEVRSQLNPSGILVGSGTTNNAGIFIRASGLNDHYVALYYYTQDASTFGLRYDVVASGSSKVAQVGSVQASGHLRIQYDHDDNFVQFYHGQDQRNWLLVGSQAFTVLNPKTGAFVGSFEPVSQPQQPGGGIGGPGGE